MWNPSPVKRKHDLRPGADCVDRSASYSLPGTVYTKKNCLIMLGPIGWDNERVL